MKIIWLPLEPFEQRYTANWYQQFPKKFNQLGVEFIQIDGQKLTDKIEKGSVLDIYGTSYWKCTQLAALVSLMRSGEVTSSDTLLFADLWYPGIETLEYISCQGGEKPHIAGILHAGTWDENDFLVRSGLRPTFHGIELAWLNMFDTVFLGSVYHKELILNSFSVDPEKLVVTYLPFYPDEFTLTGTETEVVKDDGLIVFPHRLDKEKHPEEFEELMSKHPEWKGIKTVENFTTKEDYYDILRRASVAISCAAQETFGYAMLEATALDCIPLVPDNLSYRELFPAELRYQTLYELEDKLCQVMASLPLCRERLRYTQKNHKRIGAEAIPNICHQIEKF